jgi:predicted HNH restriction endonuclease
MALQYMGGACCRCGYATCEAALVFHHKDPGSKDFSFSERGITRSWQRIKDELDKCVLLCANCHAEVHARQHASVTVHETLGEFGER